MNCKYCHQSNHLIDKCPIIICKNCKDVGHPQWLCKDKKKKTKNIGINIEKKYTFSDEIKKKDSILDSPKKNINYYLKLQNTEWKDLIDVSI